MHIFFDLDGTLTDSAPGIIRCVNHALERLGGQPQPAEDLRSMIGLPLSAIFETLFLSRDVALIDRAVALYRERFNTEGIAENVMFPGVVEALEALCSRGCTLQIVTNKPAVAARRVIHRFDIARFFAAVHGPSLSDRTSDKRVLLADALRPLTGDRSRMAMVGDRVEDVHAGRVHGVRAVAAAWGYGEREELEAAQPDYMAEDLPGLVDWIATAQALD